MVYNVIKDKERGFKMIKEVVKVSETKTNTSSIKRIVIPKSISDAMELQKGDQLVLELDGDEIKIRKFWKTKKSSAPWPKFAELPHKHNTNTGVAKNIIAYSSQIWKE